MKNSEREAYAKRVVHYYENCVARNLKKVIEHFEKEGKRPQNITAIVKRYLINGTVEYRKSTRQVFHLPNVPQTRPIEAFWALC